MRKTLLFFLFFCCGTLAGAQSPAKSSGPVYTLYLIGDAGMASITEHSYPGDVLHKMVLSTATPSKVIFLGDNVYPRGVPGKEATGRSEAEDILKTQASWVKGSAAEAIFIPGNHDWKNSRQQGWAYMLNQQQVIDSLAQPNVQLLPRDACPGPVEIPLTDEAVLVIIDSQWILHPWDKPDEESACDAHTPQELLTLLQDVFARHVGKRIILAAHHPVLTYSDHGGVTTWEDHIFPIKIHDKRRYIPLPGVGSLYPLYRKVLGNEQDLAAPKYKYYSEQLLALMAEYPGSIQVAGHDHALQYIVKDSTYVIVSGAGSKLNEAKEKGYSRYAGDARGFVKLEFYDDGSADVSYWLADEDYPEGKCTFTDHLPVPPRVAAMQLDEEVPDYSGQYVTIQASEKYEASKRHKKWLGKNYRKEWKQPIRVPVFDIGAEKGGLRIVKKGGGQQTKSLRLADSAGHTYALRSIDKNPEKAVPEMFRNTFAEDIVADQISAAHPYGAFVLPQLEDVDSIYHTNPRLVYIPDDPRLGIYRREFGGMLALFEERPDEDWSHLASFGNAKNIISTTHVLEELEDDNDNSVDQLFVLRSRMFDLLVGDWDRHDDQWRWAEFDKEGKGKLYRSIPRDRDQAFFVSEGIIPKIASRKWALPKLEGFRKNIRWAPGLAFNARYFDRSFLTEPDMDDWIEAVRHLKLSMTDSVIEAAIKTWPPEIYALHGETIIEKLKSRRDNMLEDALDLYRFLAEEVDVMGTDKHELFDVYRADSGDVRVTVYKINKEGEKKKKIYDRLFKYHETKEIRLWGRGDEDRFWIHGNAPRSIKVRVIGGGSEDVLEDESHVSGWDKKTLFYDKPGGSSALRSSGEVKDLRRDDDDINTYNRRAFQYDRLAPLLYGNFNPDDKLFVGLGFLNQNHGFRKDPYRQQHLALMSVAPLTGSYNFLYRGDFTGVLGKWNLGVNADLKVPNFVNNFFGLGNESVFDPDIAKRDDIHADRAIDYYRFRFEEMRFEVKLNRRLGRVGTFEIGPVYQRIEVEEPDGTDRYVYDFAETLPYNLFSEFNEYGGIGWALKLGRTNNKLMPHRGVVWNVSGRSMTSLDASDYNFSSFQSDLTFYYTLRTFSRLTLALRGGGGFNTGDYKFYQAQVLGGKTALRGFRKTRFYGDSQGYFNAEARFRIGSFHSYIFPANYGILAFHDMGRVWYKDAQGEDPTAADGTSDVWHQGWGGGLWLTPFNLAVVSAELGHSDEGNLFYLRLGFLF